MMSFYKFWLRIINSKHILLLVVFIALFKPAFSENIDSLRLAYDYSEDAYKRINIQIEIAKEYYHRKSYDTSIFEFTKAISLIPNDSASLKAKTLEKLSKVYRKKEDMPNAIRTQKAAKDFYIQAGEGPETIAWQYASIGRGFYSEASYDSAMVYYMKSKEIFEKNEIHDESYGNLLHFIGSVFKRQGDDQKACEYYNEEVEFGKKYGYKHIEAEGLYLGGICIEDTRDALNNYFKCLTIYQEVESEKMMGLMYTLIAGAYANLDLNDSAIYYQEKWLKICEDGGEISHLASAHSTLAELLIRDNRLNEAEKHLAQALEIAKVAGVKAYIRFKDIYATYFNLSLAKKDYKNAVDYQSLWYSYRDSARNQEHQDAILEMDKIYNQEKQEAEHQKELALKEKQSMLDKQEIENQSQMNKILMAASILVLALGIFVFIKYRESQKQKKIIHHQKQAMEFQKELVEAKNKDIMDSMVYASSIQKAINTSEDYISTMFKDVFVFYQPRDIVSGDFYWGYQTEDGKKLIAVGDCTGHGVPGAMMSMLGNAFLNEIVVEGKLYEPAAILDKLRNQVKKALQTESRRDGMDMAFCCIENNKLYFAGANLPLYVLRKGTLIEIKGNKQPVGYQPLKETPFTQEEFELQAEDQIYLFSDGYADQFGGPKGKKYKYKTFREKLADISSMSFSQQRKVISEEFEVWKGDLEQLDDVCVLGIKV
ncbi:SpoIIE family protein phosphatase [Paracrocinitomix mangrovi]|uniref:SpoIIE family protein phosphatase n=1 Tax=Paracrocinitomix mangrovi TaxID=2862509 RepID=UPI001C8DF088|nr:SpoIIE family protein phosphatase [Paracrocinitomix mangrovi]UKN00552.1 SpoIIE family protein phosphatase [Paracrocinitomix mangrovi]